ncbi:hypothetical protein Forpe1208_v012012 [Fusarium oxysporum f. sp. rapae]|uniref:Uncharacterized protein n=1 Tax=Fusarium oxysporum f. sp. rapae TaxID=485398 RepID=A0A8J5NNS8_FUSOX|nr:hypothetical protein Forpe1208_v012012 [Fusarium oxysporum f. sp. rapae]
MKKNISAVITSLEDNDDVRALIKRYGTDQLKVKIRRLQECGAFASPSIAKRMFPDIQCDHIPAPRAESEVVIEKATQDEAPEEPALKEVSQETEVPGVGEPVGRTEEETYEPEAPTLGNLYGRSCAEEDPTARGLELEATDEGYVDVLATEDGPGEDAVVLLAHDDDTPAGNMPQEEAARLAAPEEDEETQHGMGTYIMSDDCRPSKNQEDNSDDTVYLRFSSQYELILQLQRYLERACYAYGCREIPETLLQHGWDCAEAVSLERWMEEFTNSGDNSNARASYKSLKSLFRRISKIQKVTVQRIRANSDTIEEFLTDAYSLVQVVGVKEYEELMEKLGQSIKRLFINLEDNYRSFRHRRDEKLQRIATERVKIDRLEKAISAEMDRDIKDCQDVARIEIRSALERAAVTTRRKLGGAKRRGYN